MSSWEVYIPEVAKKVVSVTDFTPRSDKPRRNYVGWDIKTESGKVVSFYTDGQSHCCENVNIERYTSTIRRRKTILYETQEKEGFLGTFCLNLEFPDRQSFRIQNRHNGFYAHLVYFEIDGEPYPFEVPLMI